LRPPPLQRVLRREQVLEWLDRQADGGAIWIAGAQSFG
jgi:hypothetical protein